MLSYIVPHLQQRLHTTAGRTLLWLELPVWSGGVSHKPISGRRVCVCLSVCTVCLPARGQCLARHPRCDRGFARRRACGKGQPPLHPPMDPVPVSSALPRPRRQIGGTGPGVWARWRVGEVDRFHREIEEWTGRESFGARQWAGERWSFEKDQWEEKQPRNSIFTSLVFNSGRSANDCCLLKSNDLKLALCLQPE